MQLDLFKEKQKAEYKVYYDNFYKGVKERYAKEREKHLRESNGIDIFINILPEKL